MTYLIDQYKFQSINPTVSVYLLILRLYPMPHVPRGPLALHRHIFADAAEIILFRVASGGVHCCAVCASSQMQRWNLNQTIERLLSPDFDFDIGSVPTTNATNRKRNHLICVDFFVFYMY